MSKGTASMGKKAKGVSHMRCRRCGKHSFHKKTQICSHCGFGATAKLRNYEFFPKKVNRVRKPNK
jgi:large subunit ribosomal protein L37e